jgi:hypothetical protein
MKSVFLKELKIFAFRLSLEVKFESFKIYFSLPIIIRKIFTLIIANWHELSTFYSNCSTAAAANLCLIITNSIRPSANPSFFAFFPFKATTIA